MFKKVLKISGVILLVLIALAFITPYLFKNQIITLVKKEVNRKIHAKVDFKDVDISFFRHFPKVALGLDSFKIIGNGVFSTDTLIAAEKIDAAVNIMSIISGKDMTIYSVFIESPRIHAIVNKDSLANWDIVKPDTANISSTSAKPFKMELQQYAITNAYINYKDETSSINSEIVNLNHKGNGDFTTDLFTLNTTTNADAVTVIYGGVPFLYNAKTVIDANIKVDNKNNNYSFSTDKISINELKISGEGSLKNLAENGYDININFKAPSTDFKNILSLIPVIYKNDFNKIKASGNVIFSGFVKGIYNKLKMPPYHLDMEVTDGFFQYPDLPKPLQKINIKALIDNADGITDNIVLNVEKAHFELDNDPFDIRLLVKKPVSNMYVDAAAKGKLDLSKVSQLVKLHAGTKIQGNLNADIYVKGNVKEIQQQKLDQFTAGGTIDLNNFFYVAKDYPTGVKINTLQTTFSPAKVNIAVLSGQYLSSNFSGTGQINNLLNYLLQNKPLSAVLNLNADNIDLDKWMGTATDTTVKGNTAKPFAVPANLNVLINTTVDKLHYDKVDIQNLSGSLKINDETVVIANVKGNALDGSLMINGTYSTKESKTKPEISLMYNVDKVDVEKTFNAFNTVQILMPIGKFLAGKLTSQLSLKGKLGDNMMPDLNSLTGNGNMLLIEGILNKFAPLEKIASTLNVKALEKISVKDIKSYFEFNNGKVFVKPFAVKVSGIDMEIGGAQGFNQSLDYVINMKLPRSLIGVQGNQLINNLLADVNSKGIPVKIGDIINLNLKLGGYITNPTVKTDLKQGIQSLTDQLKSQVTDFAKNKIDSTKKVITNAVKDSIASVKKQAISAAKDELTKQISGEKKISDTSKKSNPQESVKGLINNLFKKKIKDTLKN